MGIIIEMFSKFKLSATQTSPLSSMTLLDSKIIIKSGKKATPKGVSTVENDTIRNNLMGVSRYVNKKGWVDSQGRKGKGLGVYRFANKYGANVDGYSPIYTPDDWSDSGNTFSLGNKGLIAWAGLLLILLGVGINLVITTSQIGQ